MDYWFLMISALISFLSVLIHGIIGTGMYMGNINKSDLEPLTKSLSLVSWNVYTIFLFIGGVTFTYIAYNPEFSIAAYPIIFINILGAALFILLGLGKHRVLLKMPGALLMATTALFAYLGINYVLKY
jgi:hypothetical protein